MCGSTRGVSCLFACKEFQKFPGTPKAFAIAINYGLHTLYASGKPSISPGTWCFTSEGMTADPESRDTPYHLQFSIQVSCMGCFTWRPHPNLTVTPYLLCILGTCKTKY